MRRRHYEEVRARLEALAERPVRSLHYLEVERLGPAPVVLSGSGAPWKAYDPPGWTPERRDFMLAEPVRVDADGCLAVPRRPGLGFELADASL